MYELDKQKFGAFIAALRKEKGYTQKELADMLYISNKAVSKWETSVSIPDVTLLLPLSEALGVSVTELLQCQRILKSAPMDTEQVEDIVKTAITLSKSTRPSRRIRRKNILLYLACILTACLELAVLHALGYTAAQFSKSLEFVLLCCPLFGLYFMIFSLEKLPSYYDENSVAAFSDGIVRLNIPGVRFNNRNWPYIIRVGQVWSMGTLVTYPLLTFLMHRFLSETWLQYEEPVSLSHFLGSLIVPMVYVGRKYH